jgi:hypothetical protein
MATTPTTNTDIFDFGFTAVDESELDIAKQAEELSAEAQSNDQRLKKLYDSIVPLLANLKKNPEKEYIKWPNRVSKIEEFEAKISKIVYG